MLKANKIFSRWYNELPRGVRSSIKPYLMPCFFCLMRCKTIVSQLRLPVFCYEGDNKWGDRPLKTILYGKDNGIFLLFLKKLYNKKPQKRFLGKVLFNEISKSKQFESFSPDFIFVGVDQVFSNFMSQQGFIVIPEWIMFKFDLTKVIPKGRKNKTLDENIKKIDKYTLSYEITKDMGHFNYFFNQMYLPYSTKKYGELAITGNFFHLSHIFDNGFLLMVKNQDKWIAGFLVEIIGKNVSARYSGVLNGDFEFVKMGALAACYYFIILWARDHGYEWVDFGHCRPFFNDGVFRHKKSWGMEFCKSNRLMIETKSALGIKICDTKNGQFNFLEKNPFICIDGGKLKSFIFSQQPFPLTTDYIQNSIKKFNIPGSEVLLISSLAGFTQDAKDFASFQTSPKIELERYKI